MTLTCNSIVRGFSHCDNSVYGALGHTELRPNVYTVRAHNETSNGQEYSQSTWTDYELFRDTASGTAVILHKTMRLFL